jgi:hypothetical protein
MNMRKYIERARAVDSIMKVLDQKRYCGLRQ